MDCKDIGISGKRNNQSWPLCNLFKKKHGLLLQTRQKEKIQVFPTSSKWVIPIFLQPEAKYIEFEPRLKFKTRLKYGWFNLKLYSIFQDLSRGAQLKPVLVRFKPRLKFIKFSHWWYIPLIFQTWITEFIVWNIQGLRHEVARLWGLRRSEF